MARICDYDGAMRSARPVGWSFPPLDAELGLLWPRVTPRLVGQIARLGAACGSFAEAQAMLSELLGVVLTADTVRRITEDVGRKAAALIAAESERLHREMPEPAARLVDPFLQVSIDGVMVPLVGGVWGEVKGVVSGRIEQREGGPKAVALSYFARLADADRFIAEARAEMYERGTEVARTVVAVSDGAEWIQRFLDEHCPQAVRIIDWTHAANYVRRAGEALFGVATADCAAWTRTQLDLLWGGEARSVVAEMAALEDASERLKPLREARHYLEKRLAMLQYEAFRKLGYPIGSGIAESANKLLVEERLKGPGMHWKPENVDPMLALRCSAASGRWQRDWATIRAAMRRPCRRRPLPPPPPTTALTPPPPIPGRLHVAVFDAQHRPTNAHPWKGRPTVRAKT